MTYKEKAEMIGEDEREFIREKLASIAEWLRQHYPNMDYREINRYLQEMHACITDFSQNLM